MNFKYDALLVLGAVMEWDHFRNKWDFPPIIHRYAGKLVMGKVRAFTAMLLQDTAPVILVTGGSDKHPETGEICSRSRELAKLMIEIYKIPRQKVIPMGTTTASHTLGNAENLIQYLGNNPEILKTQRIAVLAPLFQCERAQLMFDKNPYFKENKIELVWLIAEEEIMKKDNDLLEYFAWIYATPEAEICRKMEEKGMADLISGSYTPKT